MVCKHCDRKAEWNWTDADGNESSNICERCMTTIPEYMAAPGWQFELIPTQPSRGLCTTHERTACKRNTRETQYCGKSYKSRFDCPTCGRHCQQNLSFLGTRILVCDGQKFSKVDKWEWESEQDQKGNIDAYSRKPVANESAITIQEHDWGGQGQL